MPQYGGWEQIGEPLGEGGQSIVFLVRNPSRVQKVNNAIMNGLRSNPWGLYVGDNQNELRERLERVATSIWEYARPDDLSELGALKVFKIPSTEPEAEEAIGRLNNEITVLRQKKPGLVRLLDANEQERWIVTEFMPRGTIEKKPGLYVGDAFCALKAFRSVVETVAWLHTDKIVHRDIKPANVFIGIEGQLVLGDMGIVYLPNQVERLTATSERVGPRDYMPPWGNLGVRLEKVQPNFDVYMLGKLLWCMMDGRLMLPREWHRRPEFDLEVRFPNNGNTRIINSILDKCLVEQPDRCLASARELLEIVDETLALFKRGLPMLDRSGKLSSPCRMCGKGTYRSYITPGSARLEYFDEVGRPMNPILVRVFVCDVCHHFELFEHGYPDEIVRRGWKP